MGVTLLRVRGNSFLQAVHNARDQLAAEYGKLLYDPGFGETAWKWPVTPRSAATKLALHLLSDANTGFTGSRAVNTTWNQKQDYLSGLMLWSNALDKVKAGARRVDGTLYPFLLPKEAHDYWQAMSAGAIKVSNAVEGFTPVELVYEEVKKDLQELADKIGGIIPSFTIPPWMIYGTLALVGVWFLKR